MGIVSLRLTKRSAPVRESVEVPEVAISGEESVEAVVLRGVGCIRRDGKGNRSSRW